MESAAVSSSGEWRVERNALSLLSTLYSLLEAAAPLAPVAVPLPSPPCLARTVGAVGKLWSFLSLKVPMEKAEWL
jgi:hypothetical protein